MSIDQARAAKAARKKSVAIWNRRLAWVTLVMLVIMNVTVYTDYFGKMAGGISSLLFILLLLVHSLFSVYLFGFPKFKWNIRVIHIYIGYFLFIFTMLSQAIISAEPYHLIAFILMWVFIVAHVALSIRFAVKRNIKKQPEPELSYYTGGSIFRDAD